MEQVKDQQRLFEKLFVSPNSDSHSGLILSMQFLKLLLDESQQLTLPAQKALLLQVLLLFEKQPVNSLLLYKHDEAFSDQTPLLCSLVLSLARVVRSQHDIAEIVPLINPLLSFYPAGLLHITSLTRELSIQFHLGSFSPIKTQFYHAVLEKYYGSKSGLEGQPLSYFFFFATNQNSIIHSPENIKIPIKNELSLLVSFKTLKPLDCANLFWLATNHESLALKIGKNIAIENQTTGVEFTDSQVIKTNTWYWVLVNTTNTQTSVYLNGQEIIREKKGLLKKEKQRQIREFVIGQAFVGFIGAVLVLQKVAPVQSFKDFPKLQRWKQVINLSDNKLQTSVVLSCLPYATFEMRESTNCFDIFRKSHSIIGENIVIFQNPLTSGISFLGGYDVLLPLFYLARFYDAKEYPEHLQNILKIWLVALQNFKDPQNLQEFMIIAGHHLESLPSLLTEGCVAVLSQIYERLSASNKVRFLRHVGWSGLPGRSQGAGVKAWLNWLTKLYQNSKSQCLRSYGLMDVVFWLVKYLQNNEQHCCPQHYINEARALREFDFQLLWKIEESTKKQHFEAVENIAAVILEYAIIDHPDQAVKSVKSVLRLLLHKYSNCLYFTILKILKRQIPKFRNDKDVSQILLAANILPFLAALAEKVVDQSLLSIILYLMLLVSRSSEDSRREVIDFFCIVLRRLKDIHQQHFNLLSHGARKVRKRSLDDSAIVSAPMSNLLEKLRNYKSNFGQIKFLLVNCCLGVVEDMEMTKQSKFIDEKGFILLISFLPLAEKPMQQEILQLLLGKFKQNPNNSEFCQQSREFTKLLLDCVSDEPAREMLTEIVESQLKRKVHLGDYYIQAKNISRSQVKTADLFCDAFSRLFKRQFKFSLTQLYQILLIMVHEIKDQDEPEGYWLLVSAITRNISSIIRHHILSSSALDFSLDGYELVQRVKNLSPQVIQGAHFQLELNNINQEEVNFLFDIILPKLIAGCSVTHLLQDIKRPVYIFEIYLYQLMQAIQDQPHSKKELLNHLVDAIIAFISVAIVRPQEESNKSFMRMALFLTTYFLFSIGEEGSVLVIWSFIVSFIRKASHQYNAQSYAQLREFLTKVNIQPFLVQIFEVFLRANNQEYLVSFQSLKRVENSESIKMLIQQRLFPTLKREEFAAILDSCKKNAFEQLYLQYQQKIMVQQAKLDLQDKDNKEHTLFQAVEKIFEQESIGEEETRLKHLHQHQNYLRQYHSTWNELWKRLRIYHHPYGIFNAQKDSLNVFAYRSEKLKNYRFKMSKYSSASGLHPILEGDILEPWHVRKLMQQENKNEVNNLVELMRPNQAKPKINPGVMDTFTSLLKRISGQKGRKAYTEYEVLWVKQGKKARGKLTITDRDQIVFWYESLKQEDSHLAFQRFSLLFNEPMVRTWRVDYIRKVQPCRYLMRYSALELVLLSRKSLLFQFQDNRNNEFLQELQRIRANKLQLMGPKLKMNRVPFYLDDWYQQGLSPKVTEQWRNRRMTNMEYLIAVNRAASRGIYDMSQYPVFPWVCEMREEKQPTLRDLTKTMGGLGSEERRKIVTEKYLAADPFNPVPAFHFGTHYSSPGVVFNFLIRLAPFTDYCKNLQGGRFDIPDRLFSSLVQAWRSASTEVSDVRELIPEFYYMPESLLNGQRLHLGTTQSGQQVDNVELPPWAANNPYFFIAQMRQMLQSEQSSSTISQWLDLLFGVKQRGPAARDNFNVYYYLTYQDYSNCLTDTTDDVYRKSCEAQIVHFGQIPPQVFEKEHPRRIPKKEEGPVELHVVQKVTLMNNLKEKLAGAYRQGNELFLIKRHVIEVLSLAKTPAGLTRTQEYNFERTLSRQYIGIKKEEARVIFFRNHFMVYGYITNEFRIFNRNTGAIEFDDSLPYKIDCALVSEDESLILFGCRLGTLCIYQIEYDSSKLTARRVYTESFIHGISHISERDGFYAVSFGCYVSIYKFERSLYYLSKEQTRPFVRFFRSFQNALPVRSAFIADSPLYSLVVFDKANVRVYSINGQLLKVMGCSAKKVHPLRDRELNSLFCVQEQGRLLLLSTPDLRCVSELQIGGALQVIGEMVIYERAIHFIGC